MGWGKNKALLLILGGSFFVSLAYSFYFRIQPVVDAKAYDRIAVNLADGYGFREDRTKSFAFDPAMTRAGPGYQFFLVGIYVLFGHHYEPVWVAQAMLHTLSVWLIYLICLRVFLQQRTPPSPSPTRGGTIKEGVLPLVGGGEEGVPGRRIAFIAAFLFAFWPDLIEIAAMLLTETLYLFFTVLTVYVFVRVYEEPKNILWAAVLGLMTGLAILTRPPILLFVPVILFLYARKKQWQPLLTCLLLTCLLLTPWTIRNYRLYHQFIPTTMVGSYNIWLGNTLSGEGGQFNEAVNPLNEYAARDGYAGLPAKANQEFRQFVAIHPFVFIKLCALRLMRYASLIRPMGFWFYQHGLGQAVFVAASALWIAVVFLAGLPGLWTLIRERRGIYQYLGAFAVTAPLLLIPTVVESRYRFQIYPFLIIGAAWFLGEGKWRVRSWRERPWIISTALFGVATAADIIIHTGKIWERLNLFL